MKSISFKKNLLSFSFILYIMHQFIDKRGLSIPFIVISTIGLIYYITKKENKNDDPELIRKDIIERRKHLVKPQEKYASLKVDRHFVNPFDDWKIVPFYKTALFWMNRWKGNGIPCEEVSHFFFFAFGKNGSF